MTDRSGSRQPLDLLSEIAAAFGQYSIKLKPFGTDLLTGTIDTATRLAAADGRRLGKLSVIFARPSNIVPGILVGLLYDRAVKATLLPEKVVLINAEGKRIGYGNPFEGEFHDIVKQHGHFVGATPRLFVTHDRFEQIPGSQPVRFRQIGHRTPPLT